MSTIPLTRQSPAASEFYVVSGEPNDTPLEFRTKFGGSSLVGTWTIEIDNTLNADPSYLKLWWLPKGSVTIGATAPNAQFTAAGSTKQTYTFSSPMWMIPTTTVCTWACTSDAGTTGTTKPAATVSVRMLYRSA